MGGTDVIPNYIYVCLNFNIQKSFTRLYKRNTRIFYASARIDSHSNPWSSYNKLKGWIWHTADSWISSIQAWSNLFHPNASHYTVSYNSVLISSLYQHNYKPRFTFSPISCSGATGFPTPQGFGWDSMKMGAVCPPQNGLLKPASFRRDSFLSSTISNFFCCKISRLIICVIGCNFHYCCWRVIKRLIRAKNLRKASHRWKEQV